MAVACSSRALGLACEPESSWPPLAFLRLLAAKRDPQLRDVLSSLKSFSKEVTRYWTVDPPAAVRGAVLRFGDEDGRYE